MRETTERERLIEQRYILARRHPTEPLTIYNYSPRAQMEHMWNEHTRECRGLIVHDDGRVIARPFPKFFNFGEPEAILPTSFRVLDKLDGSLGIAYREPSTGKIAIASRGSFESEQARHATEVWRQRYNDVEIPPGQTWLFEIVYPRTPANRHVLDYGAVDDLFLLACLSTETGADLDPDLVPWPGPRAQTFPALAPHELPHRPGTEGYVLIEWPPAADRPAHRVKIKEDDYKAAHKLLDGITPHRIWETLTTGEDAFRSLLEGMPDEFYREANTIADALKTRAAEIERTALDTYDKIGQSLLVPPDGGAPTRKEWALAIQQQPEEIRSLLFVRLSNKPLRAAIWKGIEP